VFDKASETWNDFEFEEVAFYPDGVETIFFDVTNVLNILAVYESEQPFGLRQLPCVGLFQLQQGELKLVSNPLEYSSDRPVMGIDKFGTVIAVFVDTWAERPPRVTDVYALTGKEWVAFDKLVDELSKMGHCQPIVGADSRLRFVVSRESEVRIFQVQRVENGSMDLVPELVFNDSPALARSRLVGICDTCALFAEHESGSINPTKFFLATLGNEFYEVGLPELSDSDYVLTSTAFVSTQRELFFVSRQSNEPSAAFVISIGPKSGIRKKKLEWEISRKPNLRISYDESYEFLEDKNGTVHVIRGRTYEKPIL
jgi:hypothetical protein